MRRFREKNNQTVYNFIERMIGVSLMVNLLKLSRGEVQSGWCIFYMMREKGNSI